jgi:hypothetical protein
MRCHNEGYNTMFKALTVDGMCVIDISDVQDPEVERLRIVVEDGRVYLFQLVVHEVRGTFFVLDEGHSDQEGIEHAHTAFRRVRSQPENLQAIYLRLWNQERPYETRQPQVGEWLTPLVGYISPAQPWSTEGIVHSMLGGPITEIKSVVLEPQP